MTYFCTHQYFILMGSKVSQPVAQFSQQQRGRDLPQCSANFTSCFHSFPKTLFVLKLSIRNFQFMDEWKIIWEYMRTSHQFCLEYSEYCAMAKSSTTTLLEPEWREKGIKKKGTFLQSHSSPVVDCFTACQSPELLTHNKEYSSVCTD